MRRKLGSIIRNQSVCRGGKTHKNNVKCLDWKRTIRIFEWAWLLQRGGWCSEAESEEEANVAGARFCEQLWSHWCCPAMAKLSIGTLKIFKLRVESCSQGMHGHLALLMELHPLVWMKTVNSTHSPQVSLRQRGSNPPRINSFCFLCLSISFLFFSVPLRLGFIWLALTLGFLLGLWYSSVSRELLTYLVSGSVLDISVVWNCSSRSKNWVCAIVNLMTEWRNIVSFICGDIFFLLNEGPAWKDIGLILCLWTGAYNWKMIAFTYLEKADFWYELEREYDYRNYKEMVGKVISTSAFILELLVARKNLLYFYLSWSKTLRCDLVTTAALLSLAPTAATCLTGCRQAELEVEGNTESSDKHSHRQHLPSSWQILLIDCRSIIKASFFFGGKTHL